MPADDCEAARWLAGWRLGLGGSGGAPGRSPPTLQPDYLLGALAQHLPGYIVASLHVLWQRRQTLAVVLMLQRKSGGPHQQRVSASRVCTWGGCLPARFFHSSCWLATTAVPRVTAPALVPAGLTPARAAHPPMYVISGAWRSSITFPKGSPPPTTDGGALCRGALRGGEPGPRLPIDCSRASSVCITQQGGVTFKPKTLGRHPAPPAALPLQVLELAAELQVLGGSDVDVGRGWAGAALSAAAASSSSPQLDAACDSWPALMATLHCKLYAWLQRGFSATALLLGGSSSGGLAAEATAVARQVAAVAFYAGCSLGLSWRLIAGDTVRDAMGSRQLPPAGRPQSAAQRPTSRLGKAAAAADGEEPAAQPCTIHAANPDELAQLLALAEQQLQAAAAAAGDGQAPPALVLSLALQAPGGQAAAVLHVLQLPQCAGEHQAQLCKLLQEVADLHRRGRAGGCSPLWQGCA